MLLDTLKEFFIYKPYCAYRRLCEAEEEKSLIQDTAYQVESEMIQDLYHRLFKGEDQQEYPISTLHQMMRGLVEKDATQAVRFLYYLSRFLPPNRIPVRVLGPYCIWTPVPTDLGGRHLWFSAILHWVGFANGWVNLSIAHGYGRDPQESLEEACKKYQGLRKTQEDEGEK
jgi:hypothetical protein